MCPLCEQLIELFDDYHHSLGLEEDYHLNRTCEYEEKVLTLLCTVSGHDLGADHCGKPEHDYCYRCNQTAVQLGYRRGPTWEQDGIYTKEQFNP